MVKSCGFRSKAGNIIAACRIIKEKHGGQVPDTMEELTALPGVGRKTANVVLFNAFGIPAFAAESDNSPVERVQEVYIRSQNGCLCEIHADKIIISHQLDYKPVIIIVSWLGTGVYQFSGYLVEYRERGSFRRIESTAVCEIGGRHGWAICGSIGLCHFNVSQNKSVEFLILVAPALVKLQ